MRYENDALRAIVIASMNCGSNAVNAWWSLLFYSADQAPRFTKGMWAMVGTCVVMAGWTSVLLVGLRRVERKKKVGGVVRRGREGSVDLEGEGVVAEDLGGSKAD